MADALPSTRSISPEGILKSGAVLTRAGKFTYTREELGLSGDGTIEIERSLDTLAHPTTLETIKAPITLGHPEGGVTDANFKDVVVGYVVGEPHLTGDVILGNVILGDKQAQKDLRDGVRELSPGYDFEYGSDGVTIGPLRVNHIALVPKGRSGPGVRVLDRKHKEPSMDPKELKAAVQDAMSGMGDVIKSAITDAISGVKKASDVDPSSIASKIVEGLNPVVTAITDAATKVVETADKQKKAEDDATAEANRKKAEDDAKKKADEFEKTIRADERQRFNVLTDVMPLIPEEKREGLKDASVKDILIAAVGDAVQNPDKMSTDFLHGIALGLRRQHDTIGISRAGTGNDNGSGNDNLPTGVLPFRSTAGDTDVSKARDSFINAQADRYSKAGGV